MLIIVARFLSVWTGTPFPIDLVSSDSMQPSLYEGDIIAWTPTDIEDIRVGDVIVFKSYISWPDEKIVVHRVTDIVTSNKGNLLLETRGDNNNWTDQSGPHIPEPYIREDNLLGKVISIGQVPLKIPFIGIFGIWINEGLDIISQPTQSKESINYLGVFAPLTISAVILVVLVFILPEKAKTIKEKLRLYIFGRRPLNIKKTVLSFLIAYILFFSLIHVFAYDEVSASVGIEKGAPDSVMRFGRLKPGKESFPVALPILNPSTMPVKGIVFGADQMSEYASRDTFVLDTGENKIHEMKAYAPENAKNGSYLGSVKVYSSPFWLIFPDGFIQNLLDWNAQATIFILDTLAAFILTFITISMLLSITFIGDKTLIFVINRSWCHPSKIIISKKILIKFSNMKKSMKPFLKKNFTWILKIIIFEDDKIKTDLKKPIIASTIILPTIFLLPDKMSALLISVILSGIIAYFISCKVRKKIILTTLLSISICTAYMIIQSNLTIIQKEIEILEMMALSFGALGLYLLILALILLPLSIIAWRITSYFRNVKERKDPLLALEGTCDL